MGDSAKAREFVDTAKRYIPESESVNYLSGLIFYGNRQYQPALNDFQSALRTGHTNCDAQYYMGRIYREWEDAPTLIPQVEAPGALAKSRDLDKFLRLPANEESREKRALNYFLGACSCMDGTVRGYKDRIASLPSMDIEEADKVVLRGRLEKKLFNYRLSATALIDGMMTMTSDADVQNRKVYIDAMREFLGRVRPPSDTP